MLQSVLDFIIRLYFPILGVLALYFFVLATSNILEIRKNTRPAELTDGPLVSVLVPMRNEEQNVEICINSLREQTYRNYEILIIDDNSTDRTLELIQKMARLDTRIHIYQGMPLADGWFGKPYAMQQLAREAKGEILMFTDADTVHSPTSVSWTVTNMHTLQADLISGFTGQVFKSFGEMIVGSLLFFMTGFIIPLWMNKLSKLGSFSTAVGQFIAIKKEVFDEIGGYEPLRHKTTEDVYLARYVKEKGYKTFFLDIKGHIQCRMYPGYTAAVEGIGKNIYDFFGKNPVIVSIVAVLVLLFLFLPAPMLFVSLFMGSHWTLNFIAIDLLYTLTWTLLFLDRKQPWYYGFLWPCIFLNLFYMIIWSWVKTVSGQGFYWKDRLVG
ncbi:glycosyltransferase, family 2 [Treponema primitia ZAS-2]|uniref:Glycosyltransferase, family 2 n=1 Tax=Treponema primitia (strain ATCC BAA-887 / DSM 12427 / ZAS-2) TaxID=545694 RepID=F5YJH4_TREPZ|nr:glycosyltransferase family 2 protein [Treponema primitia]AEF85916.1 glycosyltransferase, family 2 [Treponema primitia ZAS-2]